MKIKAGFELLDVCGEAVIVAHGKENMDFSKVINLNESAAYLWREVQGLDFDEELLSILLCREYEVDDDVAERDSRLIMEQWLQAGLVEE